MTLLQKVLAYLKKPAVSHSLVSFLTLLLAKSSYAPAIVAFVAALLGIK